MAGVDVGGGQSKRKSLDSEINMIPMIDLLMVTISFLLITAVWTHMARLNADAQVPGPPRPDVPEERVEPEKQLHIHMKPESFVLIWKQGAQTIDTVDVPRKEENQALGGGVEVVRFKSLGEKIADEWKNKGQHKNPTDKKFDQAILHTDNKVEYKYIIAVIDAVYTPKRKLTLGSKTEDVPALNVTFAVN
jgi:biopolymer transport protein ExbD